MRGGRITRITSEEKSAISTYVGAGVAVLLAVVGIYFFFLTQKEKKETTTFDPNRPVPTDAVLDSRSFLVVILVIRPPRIGFAMNVIESAISGVRQDGIRLSFVFRISGRD